GMLTAEKILKIDPKNEDALLTAAEGYLRRGSSTEEVLAYSGRLIEVMGAKRKAAIGRAGYWEKEQRDDSGKVGWMLGEGGVTQTRKTLNDSHLQPTIGIKNIQESTSNH